MEAISPMIRDGKIIAAKINVYADDDDEYITFITPEAYSSLESWMKHRDACGEQITKDKLGYARFVGCCKASKQGGKRKD